MHGPGAGVQPACCKGGEGAPGAARTALSAPTPPGMQHHPGPSSVLVSASSGANLPAGLWTAGCTAGFTSEPVKGHASLGCALQRRQSEGGSEH